MFTVTLGGENIFDEYPDDEQDGDAGLPGRGVRVDLALRFQRRVLLPAAVGQLLRLRAGTTDCGGRHARPPPLQGGLAPMIFSRPAAIVAMLAAFAFSGTAPAKDEMPDNWDGLVRVKPKRMDAAYVAPGTDFRTVHQGHARPGRGRVQEGLDARRQRRVGGSLEGRDRRGCPEDPRRGCATASTQVFKETFEKAGIQVVTTPGQDVLRLFTRRGQSLHQRPGHDVRRPVAHLHDRGGRGDPGARSARLHDGRAARPCFRPP